MTVEQNIVFTLDMFSDMSKKEKIERANFCLERVNLAGKNKLYPAELSGGMKKRVGIARAISMNPKYLFCDEPNSGLDPATSILIDELIQELTEEYQCTTIVVTHDMNSVMGIGEYIMFLYQGQKFWEGTKEDILHSEVQELNDFVFASPLMKAAKEVIK
jgi:phospholipid/cholesterol/gamma-HCH transport system ATP-binding protein